MRRSRTFKIGLTAAALTVCVGLLYLLSARDTHSPVLVRTTIEMDVDRTYRLLHVADLHGKRFGEAQAELARLLHGRRYDAVLLTGDIIRRLGADRTGALELSRLAREHSELVVYVRGNHDDPALGAELAEAGVVDITLAPPVDRDGLRVTRLTGSTPIRAPGTTDLVVIAEHVPPAPATLASLTDTESPATIVLSGHMHGGQWRMPLAGALIAPPNRQSEAFALLPELQGIRTRGVYRDGSTMLHISPGLGTVSAAGIPYWLGERRLGQRAQLDELIIVPRGSAEKP